MNVPCFTVGSWFDFMRVGSVESFIGRATSGGPNSLRKQQLLIRPLFHGGSKDVPKIGELTFPETSRFAMGRSWAIRMVRPIIWKGVDNGVERELTVRYYVMGAGGETGAPGNERGAPPRTGHSRSNLPNHFTSGMEANSAARCLTCRSST